MAVLQALREANAGAARCGEAVAFIGKAFRRPDGERVARLAVEKLALLAAAAALNGSRRIMPNCSPRRGSPSPTPACMARSI